MSETVMDFIKENSMFDKGDKVIVAFSGGPDSTCLLYILNNFKEELGITLIGAHLNHCLRGDESDKDQEYAKEICESLNIDFYSEKVDVHRISKEKNLSCEMAGREARYEFFEQLMVKLNANKVALAHNANDQAETILMRIMRGTGIEGIVGIRPVRDKIYVRPILRLSRKKIEKYCLNNNINPRIDKSNLENIYARNKVRLELIPYMEQNFNKDIIKTLNRLSDIVKKDNDYLENISEKEYKKHCEIGQQRVIINKAAFAEHEAILSRIIRSALLAVNHNLYNFEKVHIYSIIELQRHETGKSIMLPQNIIVENCYGNIHIYICVKATEANNNQYSLNINQENFIHSLNKVVKIDVNPKLQFTEFKENDCIKYFDYDKIKKPIIFRYRKDGDRFIPLGMKGSKKIKDLFIDLKIPKAQRNAIPLICFGDDIGWVVGYRVSEKFKVTKDTKNILQIRIGREE
ncbi:tRNA lysidine(34) synthetase TilS [Clostridium sp. CM028]|nr:MULTISPECIES: tRNA lysidine(34) synthetase TilS [unclassified Clostridium]MBW9145059.1 tRNA lysidine(34) synthetase TilS [Clostridium sp. CM027]MBU3093678.1 tRNA lysidine(34) synthetase TilS [Clostridium sp. CF011]MBW9148531.1 tRNA lysidine(34) synthetase TilS [Clostridium sp. CM028]UVE40189.1 tRNA lysidine(34) synthetase TilS [Clostridium sp. CM027]WAG69134.1 tRNA lysidine(34) synthetase TilS [Clostridium sp. CF011]